MTLKQQIYEHSKGLIAGKIALQQALLNELIESTKNETKSSAGDKYETARAMLQIEQDNARRQLDGLFMQRLQLNAIDIRLQTQTVQRGSLVTTTRGKIFMGIALGKVIFDHITVIILSENSPLGKALIGLTLGGKAIVNGVLYEVILVE